MEECYKYLGCQENDCIMFKTKEKVYCWEIDGTLCNHKGIELIRKKLKKTKVDTCIKSACIYFKAARDLKKI